MNEVPGTTRVWLETTPSVWIFIILASINTRRNFTRFRAFILSVLSLMFPLVHSHDVLKSSTNLPQEVIIWLLYLGSLHSKTRSYKGYLHWTYIQSSSIQRRMIGYVLFDVTEETSASVLSLNGFSTMKLVAAGFPETWSILTEVWTSNLTLWLIFSCFSLVMPNESSWKYLVTWLSPILSAIFHPNHLSLVTTIVGSAPLNNQ
jgi:hypothetical protein